MPHQENYKGLKITKVDARKDARNWTDILGS